MSPDIKNALESCGITESFADELVSNKYWYDNVDYGDSLRYEDTWAGLLPVFRELRIKPSVVDWLATGERPRDHQVPHRDVIEWATRILQGQYEDAKFEQQLTLKRASL